MRDLLQRKLWSQLLKKVFPLSSLRKLARFSALKRHLFLSAVVEVLQQHLLESVLKKRSWISALYYYCKKTETVCKK